MMPISPLVKRLMILNVLVFVIVNVLLARNIDLMNYFQAFYPESGSFQPIQVITHMFMHGNLIPHLFFNMFMLWMFGTSVEYYWGSKFFILVYFGSGLGAIALHYLVRYIGIQYYAADVDPQLYETMLAEGRQVLLSGKNYTGALGQLNKMINVPAVGASGAVFGILAGFATQFPRRIIMLLIPPIPMQARVLIPIIVLLELFLGLGGMGSSGGIAHFAHIGGAITGFFLTSYRYKFNF